MDYRGRMSTRRGFWLIGTVSVVIGAALASTRLFHHDFMRPDSEQTRKAVLAHIPIGTKIVSAQTMMQADGFKCTARIRDSAMTRSKASRR